MKTVFSITRKLGFLARALLSFSLVVASLLELVYTRKALGVQTNTRTIVKRLQILQDLDLELVELQLVVNVGRWRFQNSCAFRRHRLCDHAASASAVATMAG